MHCHRVAVSSAWRACCVVNDIAIWIGQTVWDGWVQDSPWRNPGKSVQCANLGGPRYVADNGKWLRTVSTIEVPQLRM